MQAHDSISPPAVVLNVLRTDLRVSARAHCSWPLPFFLLESDEKECFPPENLQKLRRQDTTFLTCPTSTACHHLLFMHHYTYAP